MIGPDVVKGLLDSTALPSNMQPVGLTEELQGVLGGSSVPIVSVELDPSTDCNSSIHRMVAILRLQIREVIAKLLPCLIPSAGLALF